MDTPGVLTGRWKSYDYPLGHMGKLRPQDQVIKSGWSYNWYPRSWLSMKLIFVKYSEPVCGACFNTKLPLPGPLWYFCTVHRDHLPSSELASLKLLLEGASDRRNFSAYRQSCVQMQFWLFLTISQWIWAPELSDFWGVVNRLQTLFWNH